MLNDYSKELEITGCMTLQQLIDSHRVLRTWYKKDSQEHISLLQVARTKAYNDHLEALNSENGFTVEELRKMSILELANFLSDVD